MGAGRPILRAAGVNSYHGQPCKRCGATLRRSSNGDCIRCRNRGHGKGQKAVAAARKRARKRGMLFSLNSTDHAHFLAATGAQCPGCDTPMIPKTPHAPSLDRVFNDQGYTPENTVVLCRRCNTRKGDMTGRELARLADFVRGVEAQTEFSVA